MRVTIVACKYGQDCPGQTGSVRNARACSAPGCHPGWRNRRHWRPSCGGSAPTARQVALKPLKRSPEYCAFQAFLPPPQQLLKQTPVHDTERRVGPAPPDSTDKVLVGEWVQNRTLLIASQDGLAGGAGGGAARAAKRAAAAHGSRSCYAEQSPSRRKGIYRVPGSNSSIL